MTNSQQIYTVSSLNQQIKVLLEQNFISLLLEAEISNLTRASSGHWYFSLKDDQSQVRCAMFKGANRFVQFEPKNGTQVLVRAGVSLYKPRGEYQLLVESMQPAGVGQLQQKFEALKQRLAGEGLFDPAEKQSLPVNIRKVGIITSAKGAAIHDILSILKRLAPNIEVVIYPCLVQGEQAAPNICQMIELANQNTELDLIIVGRGGGSIEDLWAFNEEAVAYTIHYSRLPVISAVGHETDISIADLVADIRAATPSAAAEMISQSSVKIKNHLPGLSHQLNRSIERIIALNQHKLNRYELRLNQQDPVKQMFNQQQWLDEKLNQLHHHLLHKKQTKQTQLNRLEQSLWAAHPKYQLQQQQQNLSGLAARLNTALQNQFKSLSYQHSLLIEKLQAYSPLSTLQRGYSATFDNQGNALHSVEQVKPDEIIQTRLANGSIFSKVTSLNVNTGSQSD
ncbi:exodeoxyribonuclease VII large subunit [Catenovulum sp. 2E275]|uniref:exodeoxyribonuclease VII large subunit n=1 Tax=Catenovulum sp. 2E275 TaxID=2980497 RepID=UPI0021D35137|nr:exodeoxyribonuclease VII large subunit [Catenovulum sp. 2E275]MCU4676898.1 exodeoxyribonuclease VII large subunit [Catenovulum sp. 2E275]